MSQSIFKETATLRLTLQEADVRFQTNQTRITYITMTANKVIELRENGLLENERLKAYTHIVLLKDKKLLPIPIVRGGFRYGGAGNHLLRFPVAPNIVLKKRDMKNWHLALFPNKRAID